MEALAVILMFLAATALIIGFFWSVASGSFERMVIKFYNFVNKEKK